MCAASSDQADGSGPKRRPDDKLCEIRERPAGRRRFRRFARLRHVARRNDVLIRNRAIPGWLFQRLRCCAPAPTGKRWQSAPKHAVIRSGGLRKKPAPKRRAAPKVKARSRSPAPAADETPIARLSRELNDARDQLVAMSEVLHAISRSKFESVCRCWRAWPKPRRGFAGRTGR